MMVCRSLGRRGKAAPLLRPLRVDDEAEGSPVLGLALGAQAFLSSLERRQARGRSPTRLVAQLRVCPGLEQRPNHAGLLFQTQPHRQVERSLPRRILQVDWRPHLEQRLHRVHRWVLADPRVAEIADGHGGAPRRHV